jgi:hypothetical protein
LQMGLTAKTTSRKIHNSRRPKLGTTVKLLETHNYY